jgi:8-oxo-dGTP pyrophosphatase MutT (NUDIX family)
MNRATLRRALLAHRPVDAREHGHLHRMLDLLDADSPFSRSHLHPGHFTASAFVVSPDGAELLLIAHPTLGLWLQPGGHIEREDADVVAAARREVIEETGITALELPADAPFLFDVDIHHIPANPRKGEGPHEHFDLRVLFRTADRSLGGLGELVARWVPLAEVADAGSDDSVLRAVRKLLDADRAPPHR